MIHSLMWCQYSNEEFPYPIVMRSLWESRVLSRWCCDRVGDTNDPYLTHTPFTFAISPSYHPTLKLAQEVICRASVKYNWSLLQYNEKLFYLLIKPDCLKEYNQFW